MLSSLEITIRIQTIFKTIWIVYSESVAISWIFSGKQYYVSGFKTPENYGYDSRRGKAPSIDRTIVIKNRLYIFKSFIFFRVQLVLKMANKMQQRIRIRNTALHG